MGHTVVGGAANLQMQAAERRLLQSLVLTSFISVCYIAQWTLSPPLCFMYASMRACC